MSTDVKRPVELYRYVNRTFWVCLAAFQATRMALFGTYVVTDVWGGFSAYSALASFVAAAYLRPFDGNWARLRVGVVFAIGVAFILHAWVGTPA